MTPAVLASVSDVLEAIGATVTELGATVTGASRVPAGQSMVLGWAKENVVSVFTAAIVRISRALGLPWSMSTRSATATAAPLAYTVMSPPEAAATRAPAEGGGAVGGCNGVISVTGPAADEKSVVRGLVSVMVKVVGPVWATLVGMTIVVLS